MTTRLKYFLNCLILMLVVSRALVAGGSDAPQIKPATKVPGDTASVLSDRPLKSPLGAVLRSAVIPGWGQFYTRKHFKGIVAFGVDTFLFSSIFYYHHRWRTTGKQHFRDQRNTFTWYFGLAYALTLIDAYVDAYLFGFDQAIQLSVLPGTRKPMVGLKIQWQLK